MWRENLSCISFNNLSLHYETLSWDTAHQQLLATHKTILTTHISITAITDALFLQMETIIRCDAMQQACKNFFKLSLAKNMPSHIVCGMVNNILINVSLNETCIYF